MNKDPGVPQPQMRNKDCPSVLLILDMETSKNVEN